MKKVLYQSKRCVGSKSLVIYWYNNPRLANVFDQNAKSCSNSSLIPPLSNVENQSKIIQAEQKFSNRNELTVLPLNEEIEDEVEELNPKTWGRTIIIFDRLHTPKHLKNQFKLKIKDEYAHRNEQIESLPCLLSNREVSVPPKDSFNFEQGHGKISIIFKHSKGKKNKTEQIIRKVLVPRKESVMETQISKVSEVDEIDKPQKFVMLEDPVLDKCTPILETAKIFQQYKDSDEFVGKVSIIFNHSSKYKSRCENLMLTCQKDASGDLAPDDMTKDLENLNQIKNGNLIDTKPHDSEKCQATKISDLAENTPVQRNDAINNISDLQIELPDIVLAKSKNANTKKGKIHMVFNHTQKAKRLKQLRKHFAPSKAKINPIKKIIEKKNEPQVETKTKHLDSKGVCLTTEKAPVVETDERTLIDEILMDLNEINNQANERSKNPEKIKISVTQPRTDQKPKLAPRNATTMESSEWLDKEAELEKLNNVVDGNQKNALKQAMNLMSRQNKKTKNKKKRVKIWKSSATRMIMEKSKQSLDRLIMMNSDPQCGFVTGIPDLTRTMAVMKDIKENDDNLKEKEVTVQTFVFEEPASNFDKKNNETKTVTEDTNELPKPEVRQDAIPNLNDTCIPEYIKIVGTQNFTLKPKNDELLKPKNDELLKPKGNPSEFNNFLTNPSEIGALSINSTRTVETIENDKTNQKPLFSIGEIKPLEQVKEIGRKIKSESVKEIKNQVVINNENDQIEENFHNSWHAFNPEPLELNHLLKVVSNLFENNVEVNNEIIDDLVSFSGVHTLPTNTMKKVTNQSEPKNPNESKSTETREQLYQILKNDSVCSEPQTSSSLEVAKLGQSLEIIPIKKKKIEETPKLNHETLKKGVSPVSGDVNEDKELTTKENNSKTKRSFPSNVKSYFETLRAEAKITVTEALSRNLAKERMKVYKEFSEKFEKMGLYKKQPKKILSEGLKEEPKNKTANIKRDIELQDKFKNTPEGKRIQEYFDSFRFKLTSSMKEEPKRKKSEDKKIIISSKLGQLNPPTSPSMPSFTRRNK